MKSTVLKLTYIMNHIKNGIENCVEGLLVVLGTILKISRRVENVSNFEVC